MPSTNTRIQTLTTVAANVTINVTYNAVFSTLDRHMAANGLTFQERIRVIGQDPGAATDLILHTMPLQNIPVSAGVGSLTVARNRSITVQRSTLQEDPALGDDDEISCEITIRPIGLPVEVTGSTPAGLLFG